MDSPLGPFRYRMLERWVVRLAEAPWRKRFRALRSYVPSSDRRHANLVPSFFAVQEGFLASLLKAKGLDYVKIRVPNPTTTWFTLSLGQYFAMQRRHEHLPPASPPVFIIFMQEVGDERITFEWWSRRGETSTSVAKRVGFFSARHWTS